MKFKCNTCLNSGKVGHVRCDHYHEVKAERARINKLKRDTYENKTASHINALNRRGV